MSKGDDKSESDPGSSQRGGISPDGAIEAYKEAKLAGRTEMKTLTVMYDNYKAELTVEYWWVFECGAFSAQARQYRVTPNRSKSGIIRFLMLGKGPEEVWDEKLTSTAWQDGAWHDVEGGGAVGVYPTKKGKLGFKYTFGGVNAPNPSAYTEVEVVCPD